MVYAVFKRPSFTTWRPCVRVCVEFLEERSDMNRHLTQHAARRMAQRHIDNRDLDLIEAIGTQVEDGILVRRRDFEAFERDAKRKIERVRRLVGKRVVTNGRRVVTVYQASRCKEKALLRTADDRSLQV
jgi:hypothetical protein